jgi:DNA-binding CsgD family transcriptional regulator
MSAKKIARNLDISPRTVETYINRIKEKTNSRNSIELVGKIKGFAV